MQPKQGGYRVKDGHSARRVIAVDVSTLFGVAAVRQSSGSDTIAAVKSGAIGAVKVEPR